MSGYEYAKDQYIEVDPAELKKLRPEGDRAINVETFVPPDAIDPVYFAGKSYYLLPNGKTGEKAYQLLASALESEGVNAIGRMMITTKEHVVRVRGADGLLIVDLLEYGSAVRTPEAFKAEIGDDLPGHQANCPRGEADAQIGGFHDRGHRRPEQLQGFIHRAGAGIINAKVEGKEVVVAPPAEEPRVVNLMDALRESMARASKAARPPKRKTATQTARQAPAANGAKRKVGLTRSLSLEMAVSRLVAVSAPNGVRGWSLLARYRTRAARPLSPLVGIR